MDNINIGNLNRSFSLELCKVNRDVIGVIPTECINSIKRSVLECNEIELSIKKYIHSNGKTISNPIWEDVKEERLVCLNGKEFYILKNNKFSRNDNIKSFTGYSAEYRLKKIDIQIEDISICLKSKDIENDIYSLDELLYDDTGWRLGHIDESVQYDIAEDGTKTDKLRIQESVNKRWYDFIKNDVCDSFGCIAVYDTYDKVINLYDINTYGENIKIYLSYDNYIKGIERVGDSEDIVTRLYLIGNEEMDIIGSTCTGYPYIENYSYFIENDEMSNDLISHINKYNKMVELRNITWKELCNLKIEKLKILNNKKNEMLPILSKIESKKRIKSAYEVQGDTINEVKIAAEITELEDKRTILEIEIRNLELEIENISNSITEVNILCKRETATDENGKLIFNEKTLNELKDFIYCDTYSNDSFLDVNDLISAGKRELSLNCKPTLSYTLDLKNFMNNVKSNGFNQHWTGDLGLCDVIIVYDDDLDSEIFLYLNSYTQYPNAKDDENELDIEISNKKLLDSNIRVIGDKFKDAKISVSMINRKMHLLNKQKFNTMNLEKEQIGGNI